MQIIRSMLVTMEIEDFCLMTPLTQRGQHLNEPGWKNFVIITLLGHHPQCHVYVCVCYLWSDNALFNDDSSP